MHRSIFMRAKFLKLKESLASYKHMLELSFTPLNNLVVTYHLDSGKEVTASGQLDSRKSMELLLQFFNQVFPIPDNDQSYEAIAYNEVAALWEKWIDENFESVPVD